MLELNAKCKNCSCASLVTMTPAGVSKLKPEDYYYQCLASVEQECLKGEPLYFKSRRGRAQR